MRDDNSHQTKLYHRFSMMGFIRELANVSFTVSDLIFTFGNKSGCASLNSCTIVWIIIQLLIGANPVNSSRSLACRDTCECTTSGVIICTRNNLQEIPGFDYPGSTLGAARSLFLDNNHISSVGNGTFHGLVSVTSMDLSQNKIQFIFRDAFLDLPNLLSLILTNNIISSLHFILPERLTFLSLTENDILVGDVANVSQSINKLALTGNKIVKINRNSFPTSTTHLYLDSNMIRYLTHMSFNGLEVLEDIILSHNFITHLPYLGILPSLKFLFLANNNLLSIDSGAFKSLREIKVIKLSNNSKLNDLGWIGNSRHQNFAKLRYLMYNNNFLNVSSLMKLDGLASNVHLYLGGCSLSSISNFPTLQNMDSLYLNKNKISSIFGGFLGKVPGMKKIDLRENKLSNLTFLKSLNAIETLILNNNEIGVLDSTVFLMMSNLRNLHLDNNHVTSIPVLRGTNMLAVLSLQNNQISVIEKDAFDNTLIANLDLSNNKLLKIPSSPNLQLVKLTENQFDTVLFDETFNSDSEVKYLIAGRNRIQRLNKLSGLQKLYSLDMSRNRISNISNDTFQGMHYLRFLGLEQNVVHSLFPFRDLPQLRILNLAENEVYEIDENCLIGTPSLWMLSLHGNRITEINSFPNVPVLKNLFLGQNRINMIHSDAFSRQSIQFLDLSNNYLRDISFVENLISLQRLSLPNNFIHKLHSRSFQNHASLRFLNLANNNLHSTGTIYVPDVSHFSLNVSGNAIDQVDDIFLLQSTNTLIKLAASNNEIRVINMSIGYSNNLGALFVSDNPISRFHWDSHTQFSRLILLTANNVKLSHYDVENFNNNPNIRTMYLNDNPELIQNLCSGNASSPSLEFPFLQQLILENNALKSFPRLYLANLGYLSLRFNHIAKLSSDDFQKYTPKLSTLHLEDNRITFLNNFLFAGVGRSLKFLYLDNNFIRNISTHAFDNLPNLLSLKLRNNTFTSLPNLFDSAPRKRRNINLEGSTLVCDQGLQWYKNLEENNDVVCQNCMCSCPYVSDDYSKSIVPLNNLACPLGLTNLRSPCQTPSARYHQIQCPVHAIPAPTISWNVQGICPLVSLNVFNETLFFIGLTELEKYEFSVNCRAVTFDSELNVTMIVSFEALPKGLKEHHEPRDSFELVDMAKVPDGNARGLNRTTYLSSSESSTDYDAGSTDLEYSYPDFNTTRSLEVLGFKCSSTVTTFTLVTRRSPDPTTPSSVSLLNGAATKNLLWMYRLNICLCLVFVVMTSN